ncbi:hypothetical protein AB1Y20_018348 [Prymnesium parvum]|uniref:Cytochrome b5 heme-binding domain-containing protein n=1 Tax=Prymnesium parvum TaxID=97485 RepID=A0AB34JQI5_PRYPA
MPPRLFAVAAAVAAASAVAYLAYASLLAPRAYTSAALRREMAATPGRLLLLVLGRVYDVSRGAQYYAEGEHYHGYCKGDDHTRAFLSADFEKDGSDELHALTPAQCLGVQHWSDFYVKKALEGEYPYVGVHEGRFYDRYGQPTEALIAFQACVTRGEMLKAENARLSASAPNCTRTLLDRSPGKWEEVSCEAPRVPRRSGTAGEEKRCICVELCVDEAGAEECARRAAAAQCEGSEAQCARACAACAPSDDEDGSPGAPKKYSECAPELSSCNVRIS